MLYTWLTLQAGAPPVGLLEVTMLPNMSPATQRRLLGQDTLVSALEPAKWATLQAAAPAVGLVEESTLPEATLAV
jgi:hypothetical protein